MFLKESNSLESETGIISVKKVFAQVHSCSSYLLFLSCMMQDAMQVSGYDPQKLKHQQPVSILSESLPP